MWFAWGKLHHELRAIQDEYVEIDRFLAENLGSAYEGRRSEVQHEAVRDRIARLEGTFRS